MSANANRFISGDDWEAEIVALLGRRYPPGDFIEVPADDRGDLGMDGIGRDGVVYQCYAPEQCTNEELKVRLKGKVYSDLKKLVEKQNEHRELLDGIIVRRWMLVTPRIFSKDVQAYANQQAGVIRSKNCDYIAADFAVTASTDAFLAAERKALINGVLAKLSLDLESPTEGELAGWRQLSESSDLSATLKKKLSVIAKNEKHLEKLEAKYLHCYLLAGNLLETLQNQYPQLFEAVLRTKSRFERQLELRSEISDDHANTRLIEELAQYEVSLEKEISADLDGEHVTQLAQGDVADWLMRCPLSFRETEEHE